MQDETHSSDPSSEVTVIKQRLRKLVEQLDAVNEQITAGKNLDVADLAHLLADAYGICRRAEQLL